MIKVTVLEGWSKPLPEVAAGSPWTVSQKIGSKTVSYELYHVKTPEELVVVDEWLQAHKIFALDLETSGISVYDNKIATIQIGNPLSETHPAAFVIDYRLFTREQLQPIFKHIEDPDKVKLGQNIKFEILYLTHHEKLKIRNVKDTLIAEMVIRAGLLPTKKGGKHEESRAAYGACSMAALCRRYLSIDIDKDKELRTSFYTTPAGTYTKRQLEYAANDVIYPFYVYKEQVKEIRDRELASIINIEFQLIPILAEAELRGIGINVVEWLELWQEAVVKRDEVERALHKKLLNVGQLEMLDSINVDVQHAIYPKDGKNRAINFDSPVQIQYAVKTYCQHIQWPIEVVTTKKRLRELKLHYGREWLEYRYSKLLDHSKLTFKDFVIANVDLVPEYYIPEERFVVLLSVGANILKLAKIRKQLPADFVDLLLEYAKYSIRCDTFGKDFLTKYLHKDTGRVHTEFHQVLASTGRLSATPNLMNIPREARYRRCFIPASGNKFVIADYSQQEPRLMAQESGDPVYIKTYLNYEDIYCNTGEAMFGYKLDLTTDEGNKMRFIMKTIVLAMMYRMGAPKLWRQLTLALGKHILEGRETVPTYEYVKSLHSNFLNTFSKVVEYQNYCSTMADPKESPRPKIWDRYLKAPVTWATARCGRKRFFPPSAKDTYTAAANHPIQGCAATMTKAACILIQRHIDEHGLEAGIVDLVHDELVYECAESIADSFAKVVKQKMEEAGKMWLPDVPIVAEFPKNTSGVLDFWAKEIELEEAS